MKDRGNISVAIPWSLSHYIPLNGLHPLYRALFDHAVDNVILSAWDNVKLYRRFGSDVSARSALVSRAREEDRCVEQLERESMARRHREYFWAPNRVLTEELPGDIEFHHTAPFPSMKRPFVLHCEMFAPLMFPFAHQGTGALNRSGELREHYRNILAHPLCLGIWSHIPQTLRTISHFFSDPIIDRKLFPSRIGLSANSLPEGKVPEKPSLSKPRFLFMNSAHQNPANFFRRGGHIVLRFWKKFRTEGRDGFLMLRCAKPSDKDLSDHGVDVPMIRNETGKSIIWGQDYLANHEMNALMGSAHFFLLPSDSLHSVSIMQAMLLGTIPVVTDTVGTSVYVTDKETGIVLNGVRASIWHEDALTGILVDRYRRNHDLDNFLASQLADRVYALLDEPSAYWDMRRRVRLHGQQHFSGQPFSDAFWSEVTKLYGRYKRSHPNEAHSVRRSDRSLTECMVNEKDWGRMFESPTQPMPRIDTGRSVVFEWGGATVLVPKTSGSDIQLNDWCVLSRHYNPQARRVNFSTTLEEFGGSFLASTGASQTFDTVNVIQRLSKALRLYPGLHRIASRVWRQIRRHKDILFFRPMMPLVASGSDVDTELVREGVSGYNIIRHGYRFYGILQGEGAFAPEKVKGGYSSCFVGYTADEVERKILSARRWRRLKLRTYVRELLQAWKC